MDDSAKRVGSAVVTTILIIVWVALKAQRCNRESSYDYSYTPSYPTYDPDRFMPRNDFDTAMDRTRRALDELVAQDADWAPAIAAVDPLAIAANPKNAQCQALDDVVEEAATWSVVVSDTVLANDEVETDAMAPFPVYVTHAADGLPEVSPEASARSVQLVDKIASGTYSSAPTLTTRDLVIEVAVMPKPAKGAKRIKNAPAPGKPIARGWIYDHGTKRVVCAGFVTLPNPGKGENATRLTNTQLAKLVDIVPSALKTTPLPDVEAK